MNNQALLRMRSKQQEILKSLDEIIRADTEMLRLWQEANRR